MMCVGIFGALGNGASLPLMIYIFTNMIGDFSVSARICPKLVWPDDILYQLHLNVSNNYSTTTSNVTLSVQTYGSLLDQMKMQAVYMIGELKKTKYSFQIFKFLAYSVSVGIRNNDIELSTSDLLDHAGRETVSSDQEKLVHFDPSTRHWLV